MNLHSKANAEHADSYGVKRTSYAPWASGRPAGHYSGQAGLHDACGSSLVVYHPAVRSP